MDPSALLKGKRALVLGVANERSIAWGICQSLRAHGAQLGLTYLNEALKKRVGPLAEEIEAQFLVEMDVTQKEHYLGLYEKIAQVWGTFDILVHSLAWANRDDLKARFSETSQEGMAWALDVSAFSLVKLSGQLKGLLRPGGSIMAMTYRGSVSAIPGYNIMGVAKAALESEIRYLASDLGPDGIRANALSAGPMRTLAASGVPGLRKIFDLVEAQAPLRRNITPQDVGGAATFLASDLSSGITGQVIYVDAGMSTVG